MLRQFGDLYAYALGWPALARVHKLMFYVSGRALGLQNYHSARISGEHLALRRCIAGEAAPVVFDIGANNGEWLAAVRGANPGAAIHAFEPQASLAARIAAAYPGVHINTAAVGDCAGSLDLYDYADHPGSQHASLIKGVIDAVHGRQARHTRVPVIALDDYCAERGIEHIDFLKIDVEGYELQVLRGAQRLIEAGRVEAIQFEFTHLNVLGRVFMDDFVRCLGGAYDLYRILPHGLAPLHAQNHWLNEQFAYQNLLALKKPGSSATSPLAPARDPGTGGRP